MERGWRRGEGRISTTQRSDQFRQETLNIDNTGTGCAVATLSRRCEVVRLTLGLQTLSSLYQETFRGRGQSHVSRRG